MDEDHSAQLLKDVFGDVTVYDILGVEKDADADTIKKAYRKLALKYHPDKGGDSKKFQALSLAHSILADSEKRKIYDQTGDVDADEGGQDFNFWYEYFRTLFPKISVSAIEKFGEKYIGSKEEEADVVEAYNKYSGDLKKIMECVILAEVGEEERICTVIDAAIDRGELTSTKKYQATRVSPADTKKKRKAPASKKSSSESLEQLILSKSSGSSNAAALGSIFAKYGGKEVYNDKEYDIPDDEFDKLQSKLLKKKK